MTDLMNSPANEGDDEADARREEAIALLNDLECAPGEFYPSADDFICDMVDRRDKYADLFMVSKSQLQWLRDLHERYC